MSFYSDAREKRDWLEYSTRRGHDRIRVSHQIPRFKKQSE